MRTKRLQHRCDLGFEHRDVTGDHGIGVGAGECSPGVQAHARRDRGAVLPDVQIGTANRDLVHGTGLLALVADDSGERRAVEVGG